MVRVTNGWVVLTLTRRVDVAQFAVVKLEVRVEKKLSSVVAVVDVFTFPVAFDVVLVVREY